MRNRRTFCLKNASQNDAIFAQKVYRIYATTSQYLSSYGCAITMVYIYIYVLYIYIYIYITYIAIILYEHKAHILSCTQWCKHICMVCMRLLGVPMCVVSATVILSSGICIWVTNILCIMSLNSSKLHNILHT